VSLVALCVVAHAASFSAGGRAGVNLASFRGELLDNEIAEAGGDKDPRPGVNIGAFFTLHINEYAALSAEFGYSPRGVHYSLPDWGETVEIREAYDYLEIPLLAEISLPLGKPITPMIHAGISPAILVSAEVAEEEGVETEIEDVERRATEADVSFVCGGGARYRLGPGAIIALVRYSHGLVNIIEIGEGRETSVVSILAGYGFAFGG
jgi:hypothetical protein